ncbi:MAG TPA: Gfo/Idh/MocA family oxidoreductase [Bryobacteraceae bacterium]|jgi:predicted dehydrogenase|nr:Gfo/Idh/MocA family oxidoreductase [Bryobacteraceae bacterium]
MNPEYPEMPRTTSSRRSFLKTSTAVSAALMTSPSPAMSANDKTSIGWIGVGSRGNYLMDMFYEGGSGQYGSVVAICDAYQGYQQRAKDKVISKESKSPKIYADYHELLADPAIETVVIATPEHLHHPMAMAALNAKKNLYLEKPLAHTIEQGADIVQAAQASGRVVQVGTQNRSNTLYQKARDMVQKGMAGQVHYVRAFWYRNDVPSKPIWRYAIPKDASLENTDWNRFLEDAPQRAWDPQRFYQWRLYWDYSSGIPTDLLVHQTDITNYVCGKTTPLSCVASGGIYKWTDPGDDRDVPDTFSAIYEYPDKFHILYSSYFGNERYGYGEQFMGDDGTIEVNSRQHLYFYPEAYSNQTRPGGHPDLIPAAVTARNPYEEHKPGNDNLAVQAHIRNWMQSIHGQGEPIAPARMGQQAAIGGHLATLSFKNQKKVLWDDASQKYSFA